MPQYIILLELGLYWVCVLHEDGVYTKLIGHETRERANMHVDILNEMP